MAMVQTGGVLLVLIKFALAIRLERLNRVTDGERMGTEMGWMGARG
jgi:hypothetical protein